MEQKPVCFTSVRQLEGSRYPWQFMPVMVSDYSENKTRRGAEQAKTSDFELISCLILFQLSTRLCLHGNGQFIKALKESFTKN